MLKNIIITIKEEKIQNFKQEALESKFKNFHTRDFIPDLGLVMAQVEESEIEILRQDPVIETVEEDKGIQLPPPESDVQ